MPINLNWPDKIYKMEVFSHKLQTAPFFENYEFRMFDVRRVPVGFSLFFGEKKENLEKFILNMRCLADFNGDCIIQSPNPRIYIGSKLTPKNLAKCSESISIITEKYISSYSHYPASLDFRSTEVQGFFKKLTEEFITISRILFILRG